ncbi:hypothetical protein AMELA_G00150250 [Ameiurus melas]|uniref:Uncharacterized protein n=1 Tax=Ameiurus melas TaxID=219545 RepID=A0A7J6AHK7_AMEME|nr:hypothetical protein AMELA_G00150250 [Ameiurus melas]
MSQAPGEKAKTSIRHRYLRETTSYIITREGSGSAISFPGDDLGCEEGQQPDNLKTKKKQRSCSHACVDL